MSSSTTSDVVPFVAHNVFEISNMYDLDALATMAKICSPDDYTDGTIGLKVNGWNYVYGDDGFHMIGKRSHIYAAKWMKDGRAVYTINESEYAAGGACELSVVADNEDAINEFCNDNSIIVRFGIDDNDAVQQML